MDRPRLHHHRPRIKKPRKRPRAFQAWRLCRRDGISMVMLFVPSISRDELQVLHRNFARYEPLPRFCRKQMVVQEDE